MVSSYVFNDSAGFVGVYLFIYLFIHIFDYSGIFFYIMSSDVCEMMRGVHYIN